MADLTPGMRRGLQYWEVIQAATREGASSQQLWEAINAQAESLGYDRPGLSAVDVSRLRSIAVGVRNSEQALSRLGPDDQITGPAIASVPWARDIDRQNASPMFQVRFEHQVIRDGELVTEYRTSMLYSAPRSRRELELQLSEDGEGLADQYGVEHVGVGGYTLAAV